MCARASSLAARLGLGAQAPTVAALEDHMRGRAEQTWSRLLSSGQLREGAELPRLRLPTGLAEMLAAALAQEFAEPGPDATQRHQQLLYHYLEWMPSLRIELLAGRQEPACWIFHSPLPWPQLPRLSAALEAAFALLGRCGVAAEAALGASSFQELRAQPLTLAALYERCRFGGCMPPLYAHPHDLAAYVGEMEDGIRDWGVVDRRLSAPLLHELMHFGPEAGRDLLPYLDECVSGYLAVHVYPASAYPEQDDDNGIYGAPWFAQVGQALARCVGLEAMVQAHAGLRSWQEVLGAELLERFQRLEWDDYLEHRLPHFLGNTTRPEPWVKLCFLAAAGELNLQWGLAELEQAELPDRSGATQISGLDQRALRDGLLSMCLAGRLDGGSYRVQRKLPPGPIQIDAKRCLISRTHSEAMLDLAPPRYWLAPSIAARLRGAGVDSCLLHLRSFDALPEIVTQLCCGQANVASAGFTLEPLTSRG